MKPDYLLYLAYHHFLNGEPFPVDVFMELQEQGYEPSEVEEMFHDGFVPEGAELTDPEKEEEEA